MLRSQGRGIGHPFRRGEDMEGDRRIAVVHTVSVRLIRVELRMRGTLRCLLAMYIVMALERSMATCCS